MRNTLKTERVTEPELPEKSTTKSGIEFSPLDDMWTLVDQSAVCYFNFISLESYCDSNLIISFKCALLHVIKLKSLSYAANIFKYFKDFVANIAKEHDNIISTINSDCIINYHASLPLNKYYYLGYISAFLKLWHQLGYSGVDETVPKLLSQLRLKGNSKGNAVRTMDPHKGPFSEIELQALCEALNNSYATGDISTRSFILSWLFIILGARNNQIASLKIKDLKVQRSKENTSSYLIDVPRAKQRGQLIRSEFKTRPLISGVGEVLEAWCNQVKADHLKLIADDTDPQELPIFPSWNSVNPPGFKHHATGISIGIEIKRTFDSLNVKSERTGLPIKVTARRFRYTLGTRAAMEGHSELTIAELLDHSDTQSVGIYVEATPEIIDRIDKALALQLAPLAQAFSGLIISDESEVERGHDPTSRIRHPKISYVGTCGKYGFCSASAPIACYTCRCFQAWADAPHESLLIELIAERDRLLEITGDERIAYANDRTILAVAEVVRRCSELKQQMKDN